MLKIGVSACFMYPDVNRKVFGPKTLSYIENDMFAWHHRAPTDEELERFCEEIYES